MCSIVDACILTSAFKFTEENFKGAIRKDPTYIWDIYWKFKFQSHVTKKHDSKY